MTIGYSSVGGDLVLQQVCVIRRYLLVPSMLPVPKSEGITQTCFASPLPTALVQWILAISSDILKNLSLVVSSHCCFACEASHTCFTRLDAS